jgi:hypothetical protein
VDDGATVDTPVSVATGGVEVGIAFVGCSVLVGTTTVGVKVARLQADKSHTITTKKVSTNLRDIRNPFCITRNVKGDESPISN